MGLAFTSDKLGTVGMLLSVPLTMVIKIALESSQEGRWVAVLFAGDDLSDYEQKIEQKIEQNLEQNEQ